MNYLPWSGYHMAIALLSSKRSKDPNTKVGACIVDDDTNVIVGIGYNGLPRGCPDTDFPWNTDGEDNKYLYVVHAEANAIINSFKKDLSKCTLYCTLFPCNSCAKLIIQSGIKNVVFLNENNKEVYKYSNMATKLMFEASDVKYKKYNPIGKKIEINI